MVLCRRPLIYTQDVLALLAIGAVVAALVFGWIRPRWNLLAQAQAARQAWQHQQQLQQELEEQKRRYLDVLTRRQERVRKITEGLPSVATVSETITRLAVAAQRHGLQINTTTPQELRPLAGHQELVVAFEAAGTAPDFIALLRELEQQGRYLDVTHWTMSRPPVIQPLPARIQWFVRMSFANPEDAG